MAIDKKDLQKKSVADLRSLAAKLKLKGRSKMRKDDLVENLKSMLGESVAPKSKARKAADKKKKDTPVKKKTASTAKAASSSTAVPANSKEKDEKKPAKPVTKKAPSEKKEAKSVKSSSKAASSSKSATTSRSAAAKKSSTTKKVTKKVVRKKKVVRSVKNTAKKKANGSVSSRSAVEAAGLIAARKRRTKAVSQSLKPFVSSNQRRQPGLESNVELPSGYDDNRTVLMVRDPYWLFCYWELSQEYMNRCASQISSGKSFILRVYDVTSVIFNGENANRYIDIEVPEKNIGNWYINVWGASVDYLLDIGYLGDNGRFVPVSRSNAVKTPGDTVSSSDGESWAVPAGVEGEVGTAPAPREAGVRELLARRIHGERPEMVMSSPGAQAGSPGPVPGSPGVIGQSSVGGSVGVGMSPGGSPGGSPGASPGGSPGMSTDKTSGKNVTVLPGRAGHDVAAPEKAAVPDRDFWLVVNTELILYGATDPNAKLSVAGLPVKLRPDGTFSFRFALPDGNQTIPVEAVSPDEVEVRVITPVVDKYTK